MSIKLYATHLCIPGIQNYNGVCTNGFLQPANNLKPPNQVVDGWFTKDTHKKKYHIPHIKDMYQIYQQKERDT